MFRSTMSLCLVAALIAGCSSRSYQSFAKSGVSRNRMQQDATACQVEANRLFPAANFTTTINNGWGYGGWAGYHGRGGYWGGATVESRDVNASMRSEHRTDCMRVMGYVPVTHPVCTDDQLAGRNFAAVSGAPAPAPNLCAVRSNNTRVLVDLSKPL